MGFFQGIGSKISKAANYLGRKVGNAAQYIGNKVSDGANAVADFADRIPGAGVIAGALRSGAGIGDALVQGGKSLVGGYGGINGAITAAENGLGKAMDVGKSLSLYN